MICEIVNRYDCKVTCIVYCHNAVFDADRKASNSYSSYRESRVDNTYNSLIHFTH